MQSIRLTNLLLAAEKSGLAAFELSIVNGEARMHEFTSGFLSLLNSFANNLTVCDIESGIAEMLATQQITSVITLDHNAQNKEKVHPWSVTLIPIEETIYSQPSLDDGIGSEAARLSFWGILSSEQMQNISKDRTFRSIAENSPDVILRLDNQLRYLYVNKAAERVTGISSDRIIGKTTRDLEIPQKLAIKWEDIYRRVFDTGQPGFKEFDYRTPFGVRSFISNVVPEYDESGHIKSILSIARDITPRKELEKELLILAQTDPLTGLLNRRQFMKDCNEELTRAKRYNSHFSLILVDIDNFKYVNDGFGHAKGDEILIKIGEILESALRENDSVGRLGGDEFCLLLINSSLKEAEVIAERVRLSILDIPEVKSGMLPISASIGISQWTQKDESISKIIQRADKLMYSAKKQGKNTVAS